VSSTTQKAKVISITEVLLFECCCKKLMMYIEYFDTFYWILPFASRLSYNFLLLWPNNATYVHQCIHVSCNPPTTSCTIYIVTFIYLLMFFTSTRFFSRQTEKNTMTLTLFEGTDIFWWKKKSIHFTSLKSVQVDVTTHAHANASQHVAEKQNV
jgi:hypothetical protein